MNTKIGLNMAYPITIQKLKNILDLLEQVKSLNDVELITNYVRHELEKTEKEFNNYVDSALNILKAFEKVDSQIELVKDR